MSVQSFWRVLVLKLLTRKLQSERIEGIVELDRLRVEFWISAQVHLCDQAFIPVAVLHKGDPDAGAILLKLNRMSEGCQVLTQIRTINGALAWMVGTGEPYVSEIDADAYIEKQRLRDPDLWALEIEDPNHRYVLEGEIL
jgi:hypothetical protein